MNTFERLQKANEEVAEAIVERSEMERAIKRLRDQLDRFEQDRKAVSLKLVAAQARVQKYSVQFYNMPESRQHAQQARYEVELNRRRSIERMGRRSLAQACRDAR